ncbi:hypothetical protein KEM56_002232 [Ascosphaera pollenicola]|nr:hypothetical protein KEM56_002232 [Ascosphaera pollenicola]
MANIHTPQLEVMIDWERWSSVQRDIQVKCFGWRKYSPSYRSPNYNLYLDINRPPSQNLVHLSRFETLPLEALQMICREVDLDTLMTMRHVNARLRMVVDHMFEFNRVAKHYPELIAAFLRLGVAKWHTIGQVYAALNSQRCVECGRYGDIIYALTCHRICYECQLTEKYYPLSATEVQETYCLSRTQLRHLPCLKSVPGYYGYPTGWYEQPTWFVYSCNLYDRYRVLETAIAVHGSVAAAIDRAAAKFQERMNRYEERYTHLLNEGDTRRAEALRRPRRRARIGYCIRLEPERYMATIRAPALDFNSGSHTIGFCCPNYRHNDVEKDMRMYTKETFVQHLENEGIIVTCSSGSWWHRKELDYAFELPHSLPQSEVDLFYDMGANRRAYWDSDMSIPLWVEALYAHLTESAPYIPKWAHILYGHLGPRQEDYMGASDSVDAMDMP